MENFDMLNEVVHLEQLGSKGLIISKLRIPREA
jgi:hypothetical protein